MSAKVLSFFVALVAFTAVAYCVDFQVNSSPCSHYHDVDFDYYLLSTQWPGNVCHFGKHSHCAIPQGVQNFTIHGLWPNSRTIYHGPTCCKNMPFNPSALNPIMSKLLVSWPSYFNPNDGFWEHEWLKHGTCAQLGNELNYFSTTLDIKSRLPLLSALLKSGIRPGTNKVSAAGIVSALQNELGITVTLECGEGAYLSEVHICLTKDLKYMECPADLKLKIMQAGNSCNPDVYFYPIN